MPLLFASRLARTGWCHLSRELGRMLAGCSLRLAHSVAMAMIVVFVRGVGGGARQDWTESEQDGRDRTGQDA